MIQQITLTTGNNIIVVNVTNATVIYLKDTNNVILSTTTFNTLGNYNVEFQALTAGTYNIETDGTINSINQTSRPIVSTEPAKTDQGELKVYTTVYTSNREWKSVGQKYQIIAPVSPETYKQNIFDLKLDENIVGADGFCELIAGSYYIRNEAAIHDDDILEFSVIDKDDVLGLFSQYGLTVGTDVLELAKFIRTHSVVGGTLVHFIPGQRKILPQGLYLRTSYTSYGSTNFLLKINFELPA